MTDHRKGGLLLRRKTSERNERNKKKVFQKSGLHLGRIML